MNALEVELAKVRLLWYEDTKKSLRRMISGETNERRRDELVTFLIQTCKEAKAVRSIVNRHGG